MRRDPLLALLLAGLALPSAAAAKDGTQANHYTITLKEGRVADAPGSRGGEIHVESYSWGAIGQNNNVGANETLTVGSARTETASGQAAGKRQHKPLTITKEWGGASPAILQPPDKGSLTVNGSFPNCTVGARYPAADLASASRRYELKDVVVSGCAAGSMSLKYDKVTVRGWDPQPKQQ